MKNARILSDKIPVLIILVAVLYQLSSQLRSFGVPMGRLIWKHHRLPAVERSAYLLKDGWFDPDYLRFLRSNIDEDDKLLLPPLQDYKPWSYRALIQYFLFPRDIERCAQNDVYRCVGMAVKNSSTHILAFKDFPPREIVEGQMEYFPFDNRRGIFSPNRSAMPP